MTDMDALDRLIAKEVVRASAPPRPVDDAAIFTTITATQSPKWRFQSMFSATKIVVAGVIVALFGGFLLAGVLTQPSDQVAPAAITPSTTTDLLSTLDTEEAVPGVFQVLTDGYRDLDSMVDSVALTPTGDLWVLKESGQGEAVRIVRVGEPGVAYQDDNASGPAGLGLGRLVTGDDGTIGYAKGFYEVPAMLDGREWVTNDGTAYDNCVRLFGSVAADGTCFDYEDYGSPRILQQEGDVDERAFGRNSLFGYDVRFGKPVSEGDIVWQGAFGPGLGTPANTFEGLARYDGESWTGIPYPEELSRPISGPLAVDPDGVVWVPSYEDGDGLSVVSWDGEEWRTYGPVAVPIASADAHFDADGTINFGLMATFDGTSLSRLDLPDGVVRHMGALAFAPDGAAWAVKDGGLYVITPEAIISAR